MYNTKVVCTYHLDDVFNEKDNISDTEKEFIRDAIYRQELLDILGIDEFNEDKMGKAFHELYLRIESFKELKECMQQMAARFLSEDVELGLMILFAYDYMYLTHACICEYLHPPFPPLGKVEPNTSTLKGSGDFVEPNTSEVGGDFVEPNTSEVGEDFVEPNTSTLKGSGDFVEPNTSTLKGSGDFVEPNTENIKALIQRINN